MALNESGAKTDDMDSFKTRTRCKYEDPPLAKKALRVLKFIDSGILVLARPQVSFSLEASVLDSLSVVGSLQAQPVRHGCR